MAEVDEIKRQIELLLGRKLNDNDYQSFRELLAEGYNGVGNGTQSKEQTSWSRSPQE